MLHRASDLASPFQNTDMYFRVQKGRDFLEQLVDYAFLKKNLVITNGMFHSFCLRHLAKVQKINVCLALSSLPQ